ncbi:MAG TPA: xanthine dehydrogenase family protein molybdopterin-binding subunit [Thermoanaerobaculia bacterium]|nr:xanthine dehydrogenase family protein molybdopterin-binding subunit [Thermoanaerobaculia bacterium]
MADYTWPPVDERSLIGKPLSRLDGPAKSTGAAKYPSDLRRDRMLHAKILTCPHAHARITALDVSAAKAMPGVVAVRVLQEVGAEIQWAHDEIVAVAAETEEIARDAVRAVVVDYQVLPHYVLEGDRSQAPETKPGREQTVGDPDGAYAAAAARVERTFSIPMINHCALEPHGQITEWEGDQLTAYASTQAVSTLAGQFAEPLGIPASNVRIRTEYMGGGFGAKFQVDRWGIEGARLAREANRPVKLFLEREHEQAVAGSRPSAWATIKAGADADGRLQAWISESWGSGGLPGTGTPPLPYVFEPANRRHVHISVPTNFAGSRAWRAPNHPQAAFLTMSVLEDLAAELAMDPLELFRRNLDIAAGRRAAVYQEELGIAADLMGWKDRWRPRGSSPGPVKRGLGLSIHTWGGRGHASSCAVKVHPDGTVEAALGTQDLGTGTRTVIAMVLAETFGLPVEAVTVKIGDSAYPQSGPSGGSTTVGGVSSSTRRAAQDALAEVLAKVAPALGAPPESLVARDGRIQVAGDPARSLPWKEAAAKIGAVAISVTNRNPGPGQLTDGGVGGVQMADVSVDVETGVVKVNRMVAVQDVGLVVNRKLATSQVYGALIMGISTALYEERVPDPVTGRLLNPNMEFYRLAGLGDVGELVVHLMGGPGHDERGVIGMGEPPVISPLAAIGNAIANAVGVRVPHAPFTPERVLQSLGSGNAA